MERMSFVIIVVVCSVVCATAESMAPTPLQKTIDGLFKTPGARRHEPEAFLDDSDSELESRFNPNYGDDGGDVLDGKDDIDDNYSDFDAQYGKGDIYDDLYGKTSSRGDDDLYGKTTSRGDDDLYGKTTSRGDDDLYGKTTSRGDDLFDDSSYNDNDRTSYGRFIPSNDVDGTDDGFQSFRHRALGESNEVDMDVDDDDSAEEGEGDNVASLGRERWGSDGLSKVEADLEEARGHVENDESLSSTQRIRANAILDQMKLDSSQLRTSETANEKTLLKRDLKQSMQSLKAALSPSRQFLGSEADPSSRVQAVRSDIARLRSRLPSMHLSDEGETLENMEAILKDAELLGSDTLSSARRKKLSKASTMRMAALRQEMGVSTKEEAPRSSRGADDTFSQKITKDIHVLEEKIEASDLPASTVTEVMDNLKHIQSNAKDFRGPAVSHERKERLKKATKLRLKALKRQMGTSNAPPSFSGEERVDKSISKFDRDVGDLEEKVGAMDMSVDKREETLKNLAAITEDAHRLRNAHGESRQKLQDAMKLRIKALREEFHTYSADSTDQSTHKKSVLSNIDGDMSTILQKVDSMHMEPKLARETRDNIAAIKRDAHKIVHAHGDAHKRLEEALHLRTKALKEELLGSGESATTSKVSKIATLDKDITTLEEKVSDMHASEAAMTEIKNNLAAIKNDSHQLVSAHGKKQQRLKKAIDLRTAALKNELETVSSPSHTGDDN